MHSMEAIEVNREVELFMLFHHHALLGDPDQLAIRIIFLTAKE